MQKIILTLIAAAAIAGCATQPQYSNSAISDPAQSAKQFAIDDGACTLMASGVQVPQVQTQSSTQSGTITASSGQAYQYTARSGDSFSKGFANGLNMRATMDARNEKDRIYHGCMVSKGWTK